MTPRLNASVPASRPALLVLTALTAAVLSGCGAAPAAPGVRERSLHFSPKPVPSGSPGSALRLQLDASVIQSEDAPPPEGRVDLVAPILHVGKVEHALVLYPSEGRKCLVRLSAGDRTKYCFHSSKELEGVIEMQAVSAPGDRDRAVVWGMAPAGSTKLYVTRGGKTKTFDLTDSGPYLDHASAFLIHYDVAKGRSEFVTKDAAGRETARRQYPVE
jgi:hypothetical protein